MTTPLEREISKLPDPPLMTDDLIDELTNLCFYEKEVVSADLLFVFGSNILHEELGRLICELIDKSQTSKILITGGIANYHNTVFDVKSESELILSKIPYRNRQDLSFITENISKNTIENVIEAQKVFDLHSVKKMVFISHSYATMRSFLTLRKFYEEHEIWSRPLIIPSNELDLPVGKNSWYKTKYGQSLVWGEYLRFEKYGKRGDFPIHTVIDNITRINNLIR